MINPKLLLLPAAAVLLHAQVWRVVSLHPLYTPETEVRKPALEDLWTEDPGIITINFRLEPDKAGGYQVVMGKPAAELHFVQLGKETLADVVFAQESSGEHLFAPLDMHLIFRFRLEGDTLHVDVLGSDELYNRMKETGSPRHEVLDAKSDDSPNLILTASTAELRQFLLDNQEKPDAFSECLVVHRAGPDLRAQELNERSWDTVSDRSGSAESYSNALDQAQEAVRLVPDSANYWNTLAAALYRTDQYSQALAAIAYAVELRGKTVPEDLAFQAMALHKTGKTEDAVKVLADLQKLVADPRECGDENQRLYLEAQNLITPKEKR